MGDATAMQSAPTSEAWIASSQVDLRFSVPTWAKIANLKQKKGNTERHMCAKQKQADHTVGGG